MKAVQKKVTYTYAALPSVKQAASKKAKKEGMTLSQKIHQLLQEYIRTN